MDSKVQKRLAQLIAILAKTAGRDKIMRLFQYGSLFMAHRDINENTVKDVLAGKKWLSVSNSMRETRKVIRFLRTLEYSGKAVAMFKKIKAGEYKDLTELAVLLTTMFNALFTFLFFLADHRVFLAERGIMSKESWAGNYRRSFIFYTLQNVFGVLRGLSEILQLKGKIGSKEVEMASEIDKKISALALDIIKCLFDALIGYARLNPSIISESKVGFIGFVTSLIGIYQLWQ